jgi:hypothetical protein
MAGASVEVPGSVWGTGRAPARGFPTTGLPAGFGAEGFFTTVFLAGAGRAAGFVAAGCAEAGSGARIGRPDSR